MENLYRSIYNPIMKIALFPIISGFLLIPCFAQAQVAPKEYEDVIEEDKSFEEKIPEELFEREDTSFITVTTENDLYSGQGTDSNYTNGIRFTYYDTSRNASRLVEGIDTLLPFFAVNDTSNTYFSLGQNLYTPQDITLVTPDPTDRPYAAFLYGSVGSNTINENHMDDIELTLGVVGSAALGEPVQSAVHKLTDSPDPKGWDSQLKNEPGVMLAYQRSWPEAFAADLDPFYFRIAPHVGATVGNIYTYGATGITFQLTPRNAIWQAPPPRVRPALASSGYFALPEDVSFAWSLFAGLEARAMARNIFLDGNTFTDSPSVDREIGVVDANAGVTTTFDNIQIAYTLNWRSREFSEQDENTYFGSVSLGYRF